MYIERDSYQVTCLVTISLYTFRPSLRRTTTNSRRFGAGLFHSVLRLWSVSVCCEECTVNPTCYNTRGEEYNTVFYSDLACFMNTVTLNKYIFMLYTGLTRRNTLFIFLWLRPRNTWIPIQHVGFPPGVLLPCPCALRPGILPPWLQPLRPWRSSTQSLSLDRAARFALRVLPKSVSFLLLTSL